MRTRFALAALAAATVSTFAAAQMGQGMGPGMMHGQGMGPGMGSQDCPMMGQGMGQGMGGKGMMHGRGGMHGGRGMMGDEMSQGPGLRAIEALNLTPEQRAKVTEIRRDEEPRRDAGRAQDEAGEKGKAQLGVGAVLARDEVLVHGTPDDTRPRRSRNPSGQSRSRARFSAARARWDAGCCESARAVPW